MRDRGDRRGPGRTGERAGGRTCCPAPLPLGGRTQTPGAWGNSRPWNKSRPRGTFCPPGPAPPGPAPPDPAGPAPPLKSALFRLPRRVPPGPGAVPSPSPVWGAQVGFQPEPLLWRGNFPVLAPHPLGTAWGRSLRVPQMSLRFAVSQSPPAWGGGGERGEKQGMGEGQG